MINIRREKTIIRMVISILIIVITLSMVAVSSYAWYNAEIEAAYQLDVDASGVLYLYVEAPIKPIVDDEDERTLVPAKAMPGAVANGLRLDPLELYDPNSSDPSYISSVATQVTYSDKFIMQQAAGTATDVVYSISVRSTSDETGIEYDNSEIVFSNVEFSYWHTVQTDNIIEYDEDENPVYEYVDVLEDPLISHSDDFTTGTLLIEDAQTIDFSITMYLANVDELMDDNMMNSSIWIKLALVAQVAEEGEEEGE